MIDSWVDEVHESAPGLCNLFISHLHGLGSSDRSRNEECYSLGSAASSKEVFCVPCCVGNRSGTRAGLGLRCREGPLGER